MVKITDDGIDTLQDNVVSGDKIIDNSISHDDMPSGSVLQVINTLYTVRTSYTTTTSDVSVPGMDIIVTPKGENSRFLLTIRHFLEVNGAWEVVFNIHRNGSRINTGGLNGDWSGLIMPGQSYGAAQNNSSTPELINFSTLDTTGSTKGVPITFKLVSSAGSAKTCWVNRTFGGASAGQTNYENSTSEIIVMEIKG